MFIDTNGNLYDGDMQIGDREATKEEVDVFISKQKTEQAKQEALATISQLETSQLRSIIELMLDANNEYAKTKLAKIEAKIQEERAKL